MDATFRWLLRRPPDGDFIKLTYVDVVMNLDPPSKIDMRPVINKDWLLEHLVIPTLQPFIWSAPSCHWCAFSAPVKSRKTSQLQHFVKDCSVGVFGHYISGIF